MEEMIYQDPAAEVAELRSVQAKLEALWLDPISVAQHLAELLRTGQNGSLPRQ